MNPCSAYKPAIPANTKMSTMSGHYKGTELHRNPGLDDERFEAFKLPSRIGGQLVYPKKQY